MEAAIALPALVLLLLAVAQPSIILYDRMVMQNAAAEACRFLQTAAGDSYEQGLENYVERRLGAIPQTDVFHVHDPCSYEISATGKEGSEYVTVTIKNKLKPLPLMQAASLGLAQMGDDGMLTIEVEATVRAMPSWASGSPSTWIAEWD